MKKNYKPVPKRAKRKMAVISLQLSVEMIAEIDEAARISNSDRSKKARELIEQGLMSSAVIDCDK